MFDVELLIPYWDLSQALSAVPVAGKEIDAEGTAPRIVLFRDTVVK